MPTACCKAPAVLDARAPAYPYEHEDGTLESCPVLRCRACGRELVGDPDFCDEDE